MKKTLRWVLEQVLDLWKEINNACPHCGVQCNGSSAFCTPPIDDNQSQGIRKITHAIRKQS